MAPAPVSVVLAGLGGYGETYLAGLLDPQHAGRVRLVAGVDPQPERCRRIAEIRAAGIPVLPTLEAALALKPDLVVVCSPIDRHAPQCVLAFAEGCHVLVEKPLGALVADGEAIAQAHARSGRHAGIGFQWSFSEPIQALKRDILAGRFGRPTCLKTIALWPRDDWYYARNGWAGRVRTAAGAWVLDSPIANATAHYLHNMLFVLGAARDEAAEPESVAAELARANPIENHDTAALRIRAGGADLLFYVTHAGERLHGPVFEYAFERGAATYDGKRLTATFADGTTADYGMPCDASDLGKLWAMVDAIRGGAAPACPPRAGLPHLRVVNAAQEAPIAALPGAIHDGAPRPRWRVPGLDAELERCYAAGRLPSELGSAWAIPATPLALAGWPGLAAARAAR